MALWLVLFADLAWDMHDQMDYISWLAADTRYMTPEYIEMYHSLTTKAELIVGILYFLSAAGFCLASMLLLNTFRINYKTAFDRWILTRREVYLALSPAFIALFLTLSVAALSRHVLSVQLEAWVQF